MGNNKNEGQKRPKSRQVIVFLLALLIIVGSFQLGLFYGAKDSIFRKAITAEILYLGSVTGLHSTIDPSRISTDVSFDLFWEAWDALKQNYVDRSELTDKQLFYGALRGLVAAVDDPYTVFMDPQVTKEFEDDLSGTFEGIGAEIGIKEDILTIVAPLPGMPAEKAGLKAGDKIYAINGTSTAGLNTDEAVRRIRGPKGTQVTLSIFRQGFKAIQDFTITRDSIVVKSVNAKLREDGIYIIEISNFNNDTLNLFNSAVRDVISKNPKGIILDLRNNPGGYLDTAIELASEWIEGGVVVSEKYSDQRLDEHLSRGRARLKDFATVVLVNQGSASASEIVAGALQDYKKATIVGKKTFGKGSVQTMQNLSDGSSIKITVAKWLTPKGRSISDEGIKPDIEVELTEEDYNKDNDPQIDKALEILLTK
ncbi:MAG TPA: S41 family peptidase [bacterium]|nr:S41 family peptidase [bacterium]